MAATLAFLATWLVGFNTAAHGSVPPEIGDGWRVSTPEEQGLVSSALDAMADRVRSDPAFAHAYALLVARHGTLVFEEHFNGRRREQSSGVRSVTKSVLSLALGIAREDGRLPRSLDTPLAALLPARSHLLAGEKAEITLFDALTMQSGLRWDDSAEPWLGQIFFADDLVAFTLGEPLVAPPGAHFNYNTGLSQVIAEVLTEATGRDLAGYVRDRLLEPLGISGTDWLLRPNGEHYGGLGLHLRPRDMAKLGQLALQDGNWRGRRLVAAEWIRSSTRDQTADTSTYGYHWWASANGSRFVAIGYGGQYIYVDRDLDLVLVLQVDFNVPFEQVLPFASFLALRDDLYAGVLAERPGTIEPGSAPPIEIGEGAGELRLELLRSGAAEGSVEIAYRTVPGSARPGSDYVATAGSVVWSSRETGARTIVVPLIDDRREEGLESFEVELERLTGLDRLDTRRLQVTILDDDGPAPGGDVQRLSLGPATLAAREGEAARFTVSRDSASGDLEVAWVVSPIVGDAEDLEAVTGVATLRHGETSAEILLSPRQDGQVEGPELYRVELSASALPDLVEIDPGAGSATLAVLDADEPQLCDGATALCLHDGRFRSRALWQVPEASGQHARGWASAAELSSESGWFWFFDPGNLELMVKVLDGGAVNQSYWVFYGTLSDVEVFLLVEDLATGKARLYRRAAGTLCGGADIEAFVSSSTAMPSAAARPATATDDEPLLDGRFALEVEWRDPHTGAFHPATSVALTGETALQWFFSPGNYEMATKILSGSAINGHTWLFAAALTDVDYRLTVTDTATGAIRTYDSGAPFCGIADVEAFEP
ncbi:MAG TPA: serine hydrolase [Thermoanaerobaculia bacterium]|nr:serine hydrolase [Thermoanaerobaculia bacterium]